MTPPFRPLKSAVEVSWVEGLLPLCVTLFVLAEGRKTPKMQTYIVEPFSCDLAGAAFTWRKADGTVYNVLLGPASSCDCPACEYTDGCSHLTATQQLVEAGVLQPAPAGAGNAYQGDRHAD
jgi:hypothetical protein